MLWPDMYTRNEFNPDPTWQNAATKSPQSPILQADFSTPGVKASSPHLNTLLSSPLMLKTQADADEPWGQSQHPTNITSKQLWRHLAKRKSQIARHKEVGFNHDRYNAATTKYKLLMSPRPGIDVTAHAFLNLYTIGKLYVRNKHSHVTRTSHSGKLQAACLTPSIRTSWSLLNTSDSFSLGPKHTRLRLYTMVIS